MIALIVILSINMLKADPLPSGGAACLTVLDCNSHGKCGTLINETVFQCICDTNYGNPDCSYLRTSRLLPGLLQILLPFILVSGVGNFIIGRTVEAAIQLSISFIVCGIIVPIMCCLSCCVGLSSHKEAIQAKIAGLSTCLGCMGAIVVLGIYVWGIVDGGFMLAGRYTDAKGYDLY